MKQSKRHKKSRPQGLVKNRLNRLDMAFSHLSTPANFLTVIALFLSACTSLTPTPTGLPSSTPLLMTRTTATETAATTPTPSPIITLTDTPSPAVSASPTLTIDQKIRLYASIVDTPSTGAKLYFHVDVSDLGFKAISIRLIERDTGFEAYHYSLVETTESICYHGLILFETDAIDLDDPQLPQGFYLLLYNGFFYYQIEIVSPSGTQEIVVESRLQECIEEVYP